MQNRVKSVTAMIRTASSILIGKADFDDAKLQENLEYLLEALKKAKPANAKGQYIKKLSISTTMGAGVSVNQASLTVVSK